MPGPATFDDLVAEGSSLPTEGWDFSWFDGRAIEERPSWGYARLLVDRLNASEAVLDVQTGGGEVFAEALSRASKVPHLLAATEGWGPNERRARETLLPFAASVVPATDSEPFPFEDDPFDLVSSRHPVTVAWDEIARVLKTGGTYFSQQVGSGSNRELTDFMMGPQPVSDARSPAVAASQAEAAGLSVIDLREESLRTVFYDVGAVTYFLRKVIWTVPGLSVDSYKGRLLALHQTILREGSFVAHANRILIEARLR